MCPNQMAGSSPLFDSPIFLWWWVLVQKQFLRTSDQVDWDRRHIIAGAEKLREEQQHHELS